MKRLLHWLGSAIAVAGVVFVVVRIADYRDQLDVSRLDASVWGAVAALTLVYTSANVLLAFAWWNLLGGFGAVTSRRWAVKVYGVSQLAKYVPGNIFHFAGRQAMGIADNLPSWPLAKSVLWELGLLSVAGALFSVLATPFVFSEFSAYWAVSAFLVAVSLTIITLRQTLGTHFARALGLQVVFLSLSSLIFASLIYILTPSVPINWASLSGAFVLAWLAGLITPGAPAGLGVRELVLLYFLKSTIQEVDLLLAVLLGRIITIFGDLLFFVFVLPIRKE